MGGCTLSLLSPLTTQTTKWNPYSMSWFRFSLGGGGTRYGRTFVRTVRTYLLQSLRELVISPKFKPNKTLWPPISKFSWRHADHESVPTNAMIWNGAVARSVTKSPILGGPLPKQRKLTIAIETNVRWAIVSLSDVLAILKYHLTAHRAHISKSPKNFAPFQQLVSQPSWSTL